MDGLMEGRMDRWMANWTTTGWIDNVGMDGWMDGRVTRVESAD